MKIVKTWTNAWSTSRRYHEKCILPCLLGCSDGVDDLSHYFRCFRLWPIVDNCFGDLVPSGSFFKHGLKSPTKSCLLVNAAIFHAYHAVKCPREHFSTCEGRVVEHDASACMLAFWQALIASASDHGLEHKALPKQFELMNHWRNGGVGIDDPLQEFESCWSSGCSSFNNCCGRCKKGVQHLGLNRPHSTQ